jgi:hypothetical protein
MTNLLKAISVLVENSNHGLVDSYQGSNRINNVGEGLEFYIKDIFCDSLKLDVKTKKELYNKNFSYLGNKNNPPDFIIKNSDAVEIKKIENHSTAIALNSSYPKNKLYHDDPRITASCKNCEINNWLEKDIIYVIGVVENKSNQIKILWFIYGDCYSADKEIYQRIIDKISNGIEEINDIEFIKTNEIAKVKKVDPLGITDLRVRGMWHIKNPINVFSDNVKIDFKKNFTMNAIMMEDKYKSFDINDRNNIENLKIENFYINDIKIQSPNNPANLVNAKLISYAK